MIPLIKWWMHKFSMSLKMSTVAISCLSRDTLAAVANTVSGIGVDGTGET